jgi:predicted ArsR family transcriptional regulator
MPDATAAEKTRRLILETLRKGEMSAQDMAHELRLTTNAVRFHLASLEAEGLVAPSGTRKHEGRGKPATLYGVTPDADLAFSRAYAPVLEACLQELRRSVPGDEVLPFLRRVGDRLVPETDTEKPLSRRVRAAADTLNSIGGLTTVVRTDSGYEIRGMACPLAAVVASEPCACTVVESLLRRITGAPVHERCDRTGRPRCCFEIPAA